MRTRVGTCSLLLLGACSVSPSLAYRDALAPETPLDEAVVLCGETESLVDECRATVVRQHLDDPPEALAAVCDMVATTRWRSECWFSLAEARAKQGDRWGALSGCGRAGRFYDECLYHAWTFELQHAADRVSHPVDDIEQARPIIDYWRQIESLANDPEALLWDDWWYFAWTRHKPARLSDCARLDGGTAGESGEPAADSDRARCESGTRTYLRRTVVETLIRPSTAADLKTRTCRAGELGALVSGAWEPEPSLDAEAEAGRLAGCAEGPVARPWNPIFHARADASAGAQARPMGPEGAVGVLPAPGAQPEPMPEPTPGPTPEPTPEAPATAPTPRPAPAAPAGP